MAEAFAKRYGLSASSAGTQPSEHVNPVVVKVMKERGIDLSSVTPKLLTKQMIEDSDRIVTMGCSVEDVCPRPVIAEMRKEILEWHLEDPQGKSIEHVRAIRDETEKRVIELANLNC